MLLAELDKVNIWAALITAAFTAAPVILGMVLSHIRQMAEIKSKTKEIKDDLKANTDETVNTRKGVEEHDSVTRNIAKVATSAVCQNVAANEKVLQETQEIKKALNGGPDGVGSRFTKIEERQKFQDEALVTLANAVGQLTLDLADHRREYQKNNPNHSS